MQGLGKSKSVTWASDVNLCQVKLFLSEDSPSQVGGGAQDHLQAKPSWMLHSGFGGSDDNLPPGFEGIQPASALKNKLAQIPVINWRCAPRFDLNPNWRTAAGEESKEVDFQNQREMRVLEAIYPRPSAIPPNPSALVGAEESFHSDQHIPLIPVTPIEDEEPAADTSNSAVASNTIPMNSHSALTASGASARTNDGANGIVPGVEPELLAAAQSALSATMSNDQGNLIDHDLLMRILSDPQIIAKFVTNRGASSSQNVPTAQPNMPPAVTTQNVPPISMPSAPPAVSSQNVPISMSNMPNPRSSGRSLSGPPFFPGNRTDPSLAHASRAEPVQPNGSYPPRRVNVPPVAPNMRPPVPDVLTPPSSSAPPPMTKDISYYKSLIQQHGGERQENSPQYIGGGNNPHAGGVQQPLSLGNGRPRDSKPKIMKPCLYYNSARGCRNGANCPFQHDASSSSSTQQRVSSSMPEQSSSKRMKMDREITGT